MKFGILSLSLVHCSFKKKMHSNGEFARGLSLSILKTHL